MSALLRRLHLDVALVCLASAAWFSFFIPWHVFLDPDAFYHAKMALLLWQQGPIRSFPWLDLTSLGTAFADHHFLFHVLEAPLVHAFGWALGARLAAILLSTAFVVTCYVCWRWLGLSYAGWWAAFLLVSPSLIIRLLLTKASPLALLLFVLGLTVAWKRRPWLVFVVSAVFALSHGGWVFLIGSLGLLGLGDGLYRLLNERSWLGALRKSLWREVLLGIAGAIIGTGIHPNFPANISFLWVQVVKIGLETPYTHVLMGSEWWPAEPAAMVTLFVVWWVVLLVCLAGLLCARRRVSTEHASAAVAFALLVVAFVVLTLKSRRNMEYLVPSLAFWSIHLAQMFDPRRLWERARARRFFPAILGILLILAVVAIGESVWGTYGDMHVSGHPDDRYVAAFAPVSARARPGDRVFHTDWHEFPMLFLKDDRLRYISGIDPTFLYAASPGLSDLYRDLAWGIRRFTPAEAWELIHDRLGARFVFASKKNHPEFLQLVRSDPRYRLLTETDDAVSFEVVP